MASLNVRGKDGTIYSLSGSAYRNDIEGTKKLYVRTGLNYGEVETYGIATASTATEYSPIAFNINGSTAYLGRKETHYTYSTNSQISTYNTTMGVMDDINSLTNSKTYSVSVTGNVNYGTSYMTTFNSQGDISVLYTESTLSDHPKPNAVGIITSEKEIYKTYYTASEAQKVYSCQLTNYHSWNYYEPITASTSGIGDYYCEATRTGDWVDQGYVDVNTNYGYRTFFSNPASFNYMSYRWSMSYGYKHNQWYYHATGYHAPWANAPFNQYYGDYRAVSFAGNGNVGEQQIATDTLLNANTSYTRTVYRNTIYTIGGRDSGDGYFYANMTTYNSSRRRQSSAYAQTTLAKTLTLTSEHLSSIVESTWWTAPNTYNNTTVYDVCDGVDNAIQTVVDVSPGYVYMSLASTASSTQVSTFSGTMSSSNSIYTSQNTTLLESILFSKVANCSVLTKNSSSYTTINNSTLPLITDGGSLFSKTTHNYI